LRNRELLGRFTHAAQLCHCQKNVQVVQLEPTADTIGPLHRTISSKHGRLSCAAHITAQWQEN
jgi:hypothetical protein